MKSMWRQGICDPRVTCPKYRLKVNLIPIDDTNVACHVGGERVENQVVSTPRERNKVTMESLTLFAYLLTHTSAVMTPRLLLAISGEIGN